MFEHIRLPLLRAAKIIVRCYCDLQVFKVTGRLNAGGNDHSVDLPVICRSSRQGGVAHSHSEALVAMGFRVVTETKMFGVSKVSGFGRPIHFCHRGNGCTVAWLGVLLSPPLDWTSSKGTAQLLRNVPFGCDQILVQSLPPLKGPFAIG